MIRTDRWKLIYGTGKRERKDGYTTGKPLPGRTVRLYDLTSDSGEFKNVAKEPGNEERVQHLTRLLAEHMKRTDRQAGLLPKTDDVHRLLEHCLQPRDVSLKSQ